MMNLQASHTLVVTTAGSSAAGVELPTEPSVCDAHTGLLEELEYLKIETVCNVFITTGIAPTFKANIFFSSS
jgi:hypothetical protein